MRAVTYDDAGIRVSTEHADPEPGPGELLVRVRAAGLNNADLLQVAGHYPAPPGWPDDIPGMELAGEVVATGTDTSRFAPGDRVLAVLGGGAQAELAIVPEARAMPVPDGVGWEQAGALAEAAATAYDALFTQGELGLGDRVLVNGAAGGVGSVAVQLAVATGAHVVASARHEHHHDTLADLGATAVLPHHAHELGPFDVVLELVGAPNVGANLAALASGGRIVVIGAGAGRSAELDLLALMQRRAVVRGSTLRQRSEAEHAALARELEHRVLPLLAAGRLRVPIHASFPLDQAPAAYDAFRAGGKLGKLVLTVD